MPDFSPCGCVVDLLRSCYETDMAFFPAALGTTVRVRWYFAPDGAQPLPFPTRFASGNWASSKLFPWPGPGEVQGASRPWRSGATLPEALGQVPCGSAGQFLNGTAFPPVVEPRLPDGLPTCCFGPRPVGVLGLIVGLIGDDHLSTCYEIYHVYIDSHPSITIDVSGFVDVAGCPYSLFNGHYVVPQLLQCQYYFATGSNQLQVVITFNPDSTVMVAFSVNDTVTHQTTCTYRGQVLRTELPGVITLPLVGFGVACGGAPQSNLTLTF
jgi:hypothetical protein